MHIVYGSCRRDCDQEVLDGTQCHKVEIASFFAKPDLERQIGQSLHWCLIALNARYSSPHFLIECTRFYPNRIGMYSRVLRRRRNARSIPPVYEIGGQSCGSITCEWHIQRTPAPVSCQSTRRYEMTLAMIPITWGDLKEPRRGETWHRSNAALSWGYCVCLC